MPRTQFSQETAVWLRGLVDAIPGMVYRCRPDEVRTLDFVSAGCRTLVGCGAEALVGTEAGGLCRIMHPDDAELARRIIHEAIASREPFEISYRIRHADGVQRWVRDQGRGVFAEEGRVEAVEGYVTDATGLSAAQAQVVEKERVVDAILEQTCQFIGLLDREGRVLRANRAALAAVGARAEDVVGRFFWDTRWWVHSAELRERVRDAVQRAAAGEVVRFEADHPRVDGSIVHVDFSLSPVRDERGVIVALIPEGHDITERRQAERALRESEEKLARAFAASPDAISITNMATGLLIDVNDGFERLFEWPRSGCIGCSTLELKLWANEHDRERLVVQLVRDGRVRDFVAVGRSRSGQLIRCILAGETVEIAGQRAIILVIRDVTEQSRAEQALRESEERMRLLIEHAPDAIVVLDATAGHFIEVNAAASRLFRAPRDSILGRSPLDFSPELQPDGRASAMVARDHIRSAVAGGRPVFEWMHRASDGCDVPCEVRLLRLPDPGAILVRGSITDLSERKRAEHAFRALLEGTAGVSGRAFFEATVARLARELGVRSALVAEVEPVGGRMRMRCLARWQDGPVESCESEVAGTAFEQVLERPVFHVERGVAARFPGDVITDAIHAEGFLAMPVIDRAGGLLGLVAVLDDKPMPESDAARLVVGASAARAAVEIQHQRSDEAIHRLNTKLEERVAERTAQLAAANAELESFSYSVSHDLRSPLRAVDGFSRALEEDFGPVLNDEGRDFIRRIRAGSQRMGVLIDDMLRLSRATRVEMRRERVDLSVIAEGIVTELRRRDPDREVEFTCDSGLEVEADRSLVGILLENLIDNAWKYSRLSAPARIRVGRAPVRPEPGESAVLMVTDNGAGFDMRYVGKLFAPFQRLHGPSEFEGTGIGLATVRRIVARHGGRAWIEGAVGQGATVYFTFGTSHV